MSIYIIYVEALNKLIVKQKFCAASWSITEIKKRIEINLSCGCHKG